MWNIFKKKENKTEQAVHNHLILIEHFGYKVLHTWANMENRSQIYQIEGEHSCNKPRPYIEIPNTLLFEDISNLSLEAYKCDIDNQFKQHDKEYKIRLFKQQIATPEGLIKFIKDNI